RLHSQTKSASCATPSFSVTSRILSFTSRNRTWFRTSRSSDTAIGSALSPTIYLERRPRAPRVLAWSGGGKETPKGAPGLELQRTTFFLSVVSGQQVCRHHEVCLIGAWRALTVVAGHRRLERRRAPASSRRTDRRR